MRGDGPGRRGAARDEPQGPPFTRILTGDELGLIRGAALLCGGVQLLYTIDRWHVLASVQPHTGREPLQAATRAANLPAANCPARSGRRARRPQLGGRERGGEMVGGRMVPRWSSSWGSSARMGGAWRRHAKPYTHAALAWHCGVECVRCIARQCMTRTTPLLRLLLGGPPTGPTRWW